MNRPGNRHRRAGRRLLVAAAAVAGLVGCTSDSDGAPAQPQPSQAAPRVSEKQLVTLSGALRTGEAAELADAIGVENDARLDPALARALRKTRIVFDPGTVGYPQDGVATVEADVTTGSRTRRWLARLAWTGETWVLTTTEPVR